MNIDYFKGANQKPIKYNDEFFEQFNNNYRKSESRTRENTQTVPAAGGTVRRKKRKLKRGFKNTAYAFVAVLLAVLLGAILLPRCFDKPSSKKAYVQSGEIKGEETAEVSQSGYPKKAENCVTLGDDVNAQYAVLVNATKNTIIAEKASDAVIYPASLTKIMTLITAVENMKSFDDTFTYSYEVTDPLYKQEASVVGFSAGETVTVKDMLYGSILASGADATTGLAMTVFGSEDKFAEAMNKKAAELGLSTANFTNASGLHNENHKCTVTDIAVLLNYAMKNDVCRQVLTTEEYTTAATEQHPEGIKVTSTLFSRMYGTEPEGATVIAGKTGYTVEAGNCIASYANGDDGNDYIFVTAGGTDKWKAVYDHINVYSAYAKS